MPEITRRTALTSAGAGLVAVLAGCSSSHGSADFEKRIEWASPFAVNDSSRAITYWRPHELSDDETKVKDENRGLDRFSAVERIPRLGFEPSTVDWMIENPLSGARTEVIVFSPDAGKSAIRSTLTSAGFEQDQQRNGTEIFAGDRSTTAVAVTQHNLVLHGSRDRLKKYLEARQERRFTDISGVSTILDGFSEPTTMRIFRADVSNRTISHGYRIEGETTVCQHRTVYDEQGYVPSIEVVRSTRAISEETTITIEDKTLTISEERPTESVDPFAMPFSRI